MIYSSDLQIDFLIFSESFKKLYNHELLKLSLFEVPACHAGFSMSHDAKLAMCLWSSHMSVSKSIQSKVPLQGLGVLMESYYLFT